MVKSLQIIGSKGPGGAESFYVRLVNALNETGAPVTAVNPPGSAVSEALSPEVPQTHLAMRSVYDLWSRWKIRRLAHQSKSLVVQTWMGRATRLTHITPHQGIVHLARLGGYYNIKGYQHAHAWVANTQGIKNYLIEQGLPEERVFYIGNFAASPQAVDESTLEALRATYGLPTDAYILLAVGRLHTNKAFDTLLKAFAKLNNTYNDRPVHLVLAGDGELRQSLVELTQELGINNRVHFTGWQKNIAALYRLADLFICPSRHEPLGNVILEAWNYQLPVISSSSLGAQELISDDINGMLFPVDDVSALVKAINQFFEMTESEQTALQINGEQTLQSRFSKDYIVSEYLQLYDTLSNASELK